MNRHVIIGNGAAGITAAQTIRELEPGSTITILGAERYPMYSRPGLAYLLTGALGEKQVLARDRHWYAYHNLHLVHKKGVGLDVERRQVILDDGQRLPYDRLLIATGARANPPPYPGAYLDGVVYLDTLDGTRQMLRQLRRARRAVVIGGGITALELCEGLTARGVETHYFVRKNRLWDRVLNDLEAAVLKNRLRHHGVHIHFQTEIREILGDRRGRVRAVRLADDEEFRCDLLGVAIGVKPQLDLIEDTPIERDRGILVDGYQETNLPGIFAAGDCAQGFDPWAGRHLLDILWPSAVAEGRHAGLNMTGQRLPYRKGNPFNACLLFGLHITVIGQIKPETQEEGQAEITHHVDRGSSETWFSPPGDARSAWHQQDENTVRLVLTENRLIGALVMGEQSLSDPLRYLIEKRVDISGLDGDLRAGGHHMKHAIQNFWVGLAGRKVSAV